MTETAESLFVTDGDDLIPTSASRGPWSDDALHGGPTSALLAHLCETFQPSHVPMQSTRFTLELLAPVPLAPLTPQVHLVRDGKKIRLIEAELWAGDRLVASARLAQMRMTELALPADASNAEGPRIDVPIPPEKLMRSKPIARSTDAETMRYHSHSVDLRFARGTWADLGPAFAWVRLLVPVLPDVPISPLVRVASAADFGNGVSAPVAFERWLFINPDLNIHLHRLPVAEWVGLDTHCYVEPTGVGQSNVELFDGQGRLGHSNQSLLLQQR